MEVINNIENKMDVSKNVCDMPKKMELSLNSEDKENSQRAPKPLKKHEEYQYLDKIAEVIQDGDIRIDRTNIGTKSIFGTQARYSLRNSKFTIKMINNRFKISNFILCSKDTLPLLTTKKVFIKGVIHELLWFIKGSTNAIELKEKGVKIWDGNSSREFLDKYGFTEREVGDLGPIYGFQWRHFGAEYKDMHADYTNQGLDQLKEVIWKIKNTPNDRRIIMTAWNPTGI